jgi:hypothetical protein
MVTQEVKRVTQYGRGPYWADLLHLEALVSTKWQWQLSCFDVYLVKSYTTTNDPNLNKHYNIPHAEIKITHNFP